MKFCDRCHTNVEDLCEHCTSCTICCEENNCYDCKEISEIVKMIKSEQDCKIFLGLMLK